jgi:hypothetical protein
MTKVWPLYSPKETFGPYSCGMCGKKFGAAELPDLYPSETIRCRDCVEAARESVNDLSEQVNALFNRTKN